MRSCFKTGSATSFTLAQATDRRRRRAAGSEQRAASSEQRAAGSEQRAANNTRGAASGVGWTGEACSVRALPPHNLGHCLASPRKSVRVRASLCSFPVVSMDKAITPCMVRRSTIIYDLVPTPASWVPPVTP